MSTLSEITIRLPIDAGSRNPMLDAVSGNTPEMWRGTAVRFPWALFYNGELKAINNLASVTLEVKAKENRLGPSLMTQTVSASDLNNALTQEQWDDGTSQHGSFTFNGELTKLDLDAEDSKDFWLVISAKTTDTPFKQLTLGATLITIFEDGTPDGSQTPSLGSNLVPGGAVYNGSGLYTLAVTQNRAYRYIPGANETSLVNGTETLTAAGNFTAQGTTVVLHGTAGQAVTAYIRNPNYLTADEADARYQLKWEVSDLLDEIDAAQADATAAVATASAAQAAVSALAGQMHDPVTIGDVSPNIVPVMTANNLPSGYVASASQELTPAWKAFDQVINSTGQGWTANTPPAPDPDCVCEPGHQPNIWLALLFPSGKAVTAYEIVGPSSTSRAPKSWYLEGSNDGVAWTILDTVVNQTGWTAHQARKFEIPHDDGTTYTIYRLKIVDTNGDSVTEVEELRFEDVCETIIAEIDGQVIYLRVRLAPSGHIICGPGGLMIDFEPFQFAENEGGVIYADVAPDVDLFPKYKTWFWLDTSVSPRIAMEYNSQEGIWEPIDKGLLDNQGLIITSSTPPDAINVPFYGLCLWRFPDLSPPSLSIWDDITKDWINICTVCGLGSSYAGRLPSVVFDPESGASIPVTVEMSVPGVNGATIYYTIDGSDPTDESTVYDPENPPEIDDVTTLKAFATKSGYQDSLITTAQYGYPITSAWLLNFNYRATGQPNKTGSAATYDDAFTDIWNNVIAPTSSQPGGVLRNADNTVSAVVLSYSIWGAGNTFQYGVTSNPDSMFSRWIKNVDTFSRDFGLYLFVEAGVYDLYVYGHGSTDADNSQFYAEDEFSARTPEATSTGSDWNNTAWTEGKQFVLFPDLEPVSFSRHGSEYDLYESSILLIMKWNAAKGYLCGWQLRKKNQLPKVRFSPASGANTPTSVAMQCPGFPTVEIRYTTNGTTPTGSSTLYTAPITVSSPATIKAIATSPGNPTGLADSAVASATYV